MSNELESDRAIVMNLESFGVDGVGYDDSETETEPPIEDHVSGHSDSSSKLYASCLSAVFVFVTLVFADMIQKFDVTTVVDSDLQCICTDLPGLGRTRTRLQVFRAIS